MEMDSILHDEVLMAGMENLGIDRRHDLDGEIVRPDDPDLKAREPARAFESDARRAVIEGPGLRVPTAPMTGAHEYRIAGPDRLLCDALTFEAGLEIGEHDLFADVEHPPFQALDVEQDAAGEERRRVFDPEFLEPVRRPHLGQAIAVVEEHFGLVAPHPAHAAEMAERVHLGADLADFGGDEFVVPDRL